MKGFLYRLILIAHAAAVAAACGGVPMKVLAVRGSPIDLGPVPEDVEGEPYAIAAAGNDLWMLETGKGQLEVRRFSAGGEVGDPEIILKLQPELWGLGEDVPGDAILSPDLADSPPGDLQACLGPGLEEMGRVIRLYRASLVPVGDGFGVIFGARAPVRCGDQGIETVASVEHVVVFDAAWNRIQDDRAVWVGDPPLEAVPVLSGGRLDAAWLAPDGVWVSGAGRPPSREIGFVSRWSPAAMPVHFLVQGPEGVAAFVLGVVETPMATVGKGDSYLVLHSAHAGDPSSQEVTRTPLPEKPRAVAAAWTGETLGVAIFAEVVRPHAESNAWVWYAGFDASGEAQGGLVTILEWKSATGRSFGLSGLDVASDGSSIAAAWLHEGDLGPLVDVATSDGTAWGEPATHDVGWEGAADPRILPGGDGFLLLWSDTSLRLLVLAP